ncbi:uncharacterized protein LOC132205656 [Neocloeon triangulifer]|uniref:uncharacterized protein LOC132205656 n=1 Tax=Neocloeon triangulifer TaxID=2078957 RepID=UPI00286F3C6A|nr:uncharacterized protein LOC132205656 [Neocloeon triangulifer]
MGKNVQFVIFILALVLYAAAEAKKSSKRHTILKCCGASSCVKTGSNNKIAEATNTTSLRSTTIGKSESTEMDPPTQAETEPSSLPSLEITTEEQTTEVSAPLFLDKFVLINHYYFHRPTTFSVITSTSTTTTTATTVITSTTTKPPTKEELILGTCETTFERDNTLFNTDGTLKDPEKYGFWVQSCGQQLLFGKSLATWRDNFIRCYKIGMEPLTFENATKLSCFSNLVSKWKYNSNYWTSALRVNESDFSWCTKDGSFTVEKSTLPWATGQPQNANNSENCLHLNVSKANANFSFSDRICTEPQIFACQGAPTPAPTCSSPLCPNITCAKNLLFYTTMGNSQYLTNPKLHGSWFTYNGRSYLFSSTNKTTSYLGAMQACCEVGMTLLSLEYDYKYKSIIQAIKENVSLSDYFWTSGSDRGCESKFGYCTAKRILRTEAVWAPGQPDNAGGNENSVAVFIDSAKAQLLDYNEDSKLKFICEARDTSKSSSGGTAVRDECVAIYNVSQAEIDGLLNPSIQKDTRMKCFIKCLGENAGLMVNGKFLENEVLATLEKISAGNVDELQKSMGVMDECGNSSNGMDECDKAAQMIKCSSEKAPDVLNGIITSMDQSMPIEAPAMPPQALCYDPNDCVVNATCANEVSSCTGNCTVTHGYVRNVCGKRYLHHNGNVNFKQAVINCCVHGMKLATIENVAELNCLTGLNTPFSGGWTWFSLSRMNSTTARWCTSNATFSFDGFGAITENLDPSYDTYVINPNTKAISITRTIYTTYPLCVSP